MVNLPKGSEVGKQSVLIPFSVCKGLIYICEPTGDPLPDHPQISPNAQQVGYTLPQRVSSSSIS